jgi:hypothetical protein
MSMKEELERNMKETKEIQESIKTSDERFIETLEIK